MQFVPRGGDYSTEAKTVLKKHHGLLLSSFVSLFFSHKSFNLLSEQTANRGLAPSSKDPGLLEYLSAQAYRNVLLLSRS